MKNLIIMTMLFGVRNNYNYKPLINQLNTNINMKTKDSNLPQNKAMKCEPVLAVIYSDGKDYSHLKANTDENPEHDECVYCGSNNQTITDMADICHDCGEVYT